MKCSIITASAALIGSVAASQRRAHQAFHQRYYAEEVCTVYTTVYVHASELPPVVVNSTVYIVPSPVSTSYTESSTPIYIPDVSSIVLPSVEVPSVTEIYTPPAPTSTEAAYTPPAPTSTEAAYTPPVPTSTEAAYTPPAYTSEVPEVLAYTAPVYSAPIPEVTKEVYTSAPVYTPAPVSSYSKVVEAPKPSKHVTIGGGGSYGETGRIVTKGDKWAITYTPYSAGGDCKSAGEVKSDVEKIANMGFTTIRSYSTDCGVFENVIPACQEHGLKIIFGIFLTGGGAGGEGPFSPYADEQLQTILENAPKESIAMVIVGNEFLFNNYGTAEELASYIDHVREQFAGAGFPSDIAITTTEPVDVWENKGAPLCSHIDVFAVQIHPYFTAKVSASEAGDFAVEQLALAAAVCPEAAAKGQYITEIGWPHAGDVNGDAVAGKSEQKAAMKSILKKVGKEACIFSFQDDLWKEPGALNVEQAFGCADAL